MIVNGDDVILENEKKLFSIIIYLYNCDIHFEEAIESIINQNIGFEDNVQLILIDDGSEDNSYSLALEYEKRFPKNILVISQDKLGVANAFNRGLRYATGDYINFMESFDYIDLNALKEIKKGFLRMVQELDVKKEVSSIYWNFLIFILLIFIQHFLKEKLFQILLLIHD